MDLERRKLEEMGLREAANLMRQGLSMGLAEHKTRYLHLEEMRGRVVGCALGALVLGGGGEPSMGWTQKKVIDFAIAVTGLPLDILLEIERKHVYGQSIESIILDLERRADELMAG